MRTSLIILSTALLFAAQPLHAATPAVDALKATKIATDFLAKRGGNAPHIVSVVLETSALVKGTQSWIVRWSGPIDDGGTKEVGIRVKLDGSIARLVEGPGSRRKKQNATPGFY